MTTPSSIETRVAHLLGPGHLKVDNGHLAYCPLGGRSMRLDPKYVGSLLLYGRISISDEALRLLLLHGIDCACFDTGGQRCRGRVVRHDESTIKLRLAQYRLLDDRPARLQLAGEFVRAKIASQVEAARHYQRQGRVRSAGLVLERLQSAIACSHSAATLDQLRGTEAQAARAWFTLLADLVQPDWTFPRRSRRPPVDPVNSMLSFGYTLLLQRQIARCQAEGLEVALGFLHDLHPGRPSLACDFIEPLRVPCVDRWVINVCRRRTMKADDFFLRPGQGFRCQPQHLPRLIASFEGHQQDVHLVTRMDEQMRHFLQRLRAANLTETASEIPASPG